MFDIWNWIIVKGYLTVTLICILKHLFKRFHYEHDPLMFDNHKEIHFLTWK